MILALLEIYAATGEKKYYDFADAFIDHRVQVTKMIASEAITYAVLGCAAGCIVGLPLHKMLYDFLIVEHFAYAVWEFPIASLVIILVFISLAAVAAVYVPAKHIRNMPVTATINEL